MKNLVIIIILIVLGCEKSPKTVSRAPKSDDLIKIYSWDEYEKVKSKNPIQKIEIIDTICPFETKLAKRDIEKNKLTLYTYNCIAGTLDELNLILKPYNIIAKEGNKGCIRPPEGLNYFCYENLMWAEINKRYGEEWREKMEREAIKNYVIKHPDEPYFEDGIDLRKKYLSN
jgi:hypothetical protein